MSSGNITFTEHTCTFMTKSPCGTQSSTVAKSWTSLDALPLWDCQLGVVSGYFVVAQKVRLAPASNGSLSNNNQE